MSTKTEADYQLKLMEAKRLIDTHNYLRKPGPDDNRVVYEDFLSQLIAIGGTSNEMLQQVSADDLQEVCKLPVLLARRLAEIFQQDHTALPIIGGKVAAPSGYWTEDFWEEHRNETYRRQKAKEVV